jgi:hypothetical protein
MIPPARRPKPASSTNKTKISPKQPVSFTALGGYEGVFYELSSSNDIDNTYQLKPTLVPAQARV